MKRSPPLLRGGVRALRAESSSGSSESRLSCADGRCTICTKKTGNHLLSPGSASTQSKLSWTDTSGNKDAAFYLSSRYLTSSAT
ncbi:hypothetical protein EVAR_43523_1 [Eumeta japonica]|uniref:Uncharacterized protein n=1 Tax=Eumeta variegata TaxID=151549 RepID=A0A4C1WBH3_EUMVA|nr:hypothetical protein EVAR_43523_1 [Eumeta japonica]